MSIFPEENKYLDDLLHKVENRLRDRSKHDYRSDLNNYLARDENIGALSREQLYRIANVFGPIDPYMEKHHPVFHIDVDYYGAFRNVSRAALKTGDADLIYRVYGEITFPPHIDRAGAGLRCDLVIEGVNALLNLGDKRKAGKLLLDLAGNCFRIYGGGHEYCEKAIKYISPDDHAFCTLAHALLFIMNLANEHNLPKPEDYFAVSSVIRDDGTRCSCAGTHGCGSVIGSNIEYEYPCTWEMCILHQPMLNAGYIGSITVFDRTLKPGENVSITSEKDNVIGTVTLISENEKVTLSNGKEFYCRVYETKKYGWIIENCFAEDIGLIRCVFYREKVDAPKCIYELDEYEIKGGFGLLPLASGNKWSYKQIEPNEKENGEKHYVFREIISSDDECFYMSAVDCQL